MQPPKRVEILGVNVHDVTYQEALDWTEHLIRSGRPHQVVTPNPEFVMLARRDASFRQVLNDASLSIPDGSGLLYAGRLFGTPFREHVFGTDFVEQLMARAAARGFRVFLLGAAPGVAAAAARSLEQRFPGLLIAGTFAGSPDEGPAGPTLRAVVAAGRVDVLLVAYGAPRQDLWIHRYAPALDLGVGIGIGGVLDFFAGRVPRAPAWVRRLELEWLYRLIRQPWRWKRQLALLRFAALAVWQAVVRRTRSGKPR